MMLKIGDRILYEVEDRNDGLVKGNVVAIAENRIDKVTTYLVQLSSGEYIQIKSDNLDRCKLDESVLIGNSLPEPGVIN